MALDVVLVRSEIVEVAFDELQPGPNANVVPNNEKVRQDHADRDATIQVLISISKRRYARTRDSFRDKTRAR